MRRVLLVAVVTSAAVACSEPVDTNARPSPAAPAAPRPSASAAPVASAPQPAPGATDGGLADEADAGEWQGPWMYALFAATPIMSDMDWPVREDQLRPGERQRSIRIGYFRQGQRLPVFPEAHKKPNCPDGWYELVTGGFVCAKYATLDPNHPKVKNAPHPPDLAGPLPYSYGINLTNGLPMYKRLPSREERVRYEPWLAHRRIAKPKVDDDPLVDQAPTLIPTASAGLAAATANDPLGAGMDPNAGVPWYLREYDGGKPDDVKLDDLREIDAAGPVEKRMIKGFYVSLDRDSQSFGAHWWKTVGGYYVPFDRLYVPPMPTQFHGIWLNRDPDPTFNATTVDAGLPALPDHRVDKLPIAFVVYKTPRFKPSEDGKKMVRDGWAQRFTIAPLTGEKKSVDRQSYLETDEGYWLREDLVTLTNPGPPPDKLGPNEKWIDVNLKNETLVLFEGTTPVYATLVSSGKRDLKNREKDHPTHNGVFRIREKHVAATMDADTATDGPYSIEDVPWIQYFNGSIALHGAFWHSNFGHTQSHGCINLSPWDARAIFGWTEPQLPPGWHGVHSTSDRPGTIVVVHDEQKPLYEDEDDAGE
jgi:hypothetical protein